MKRALSALMLVLLAACGGATVPLGGGTGADSKSDGGTNGNWGAIGDSAATFDDPGFPVATTATKIDVLVAVDDSPGMGVKQALFANSFPTFLTDLANAKTTNDIHIGVVTSSLGGDGPEDACGPEKNRHGHLVRTADVPDGVISYEKFRSVDAMGGFAAEAVKSVGQNGCGFEAQLESVYRFLVQPDPYDQLKVDGFGMADLGQGVDIDVLKDRAAFLRPDSLLIVLMLTDEDDSAVDPVAVGGFGFAFAARTFPGSKISRGTGGGTTAPRGTSTCATQPQSAACTSCGFGATCDTQLATCQAIRSDANCTTSGDPTHNGPGYDGFYNPTDDDLAVRFFRMKERYGVDPQFPVSRYVAGFSASSVPERNTEHTTALGVNGQREIGEYHYQKKCTNPLFAQSLPTQAGDELCNLPRGPRGPELVIFGLLGGFPTELGGNWTALVGVDPASFNYTGLDPRMLPSSVPRGLPEDWDTKRQDLEYACTFPLTAPYETPLDCSQGEIGCACAPDPSVGPSSSPVCKGTTQVADKAYPTVRELRVAQALGARATIGSICNTQNGTYLDFLRSMEGAATARLR
jgi:hypothetical protein